MPEPWPIPKFSFEVIIDGQHSRFAEVTGLDIETQVIEYRAGNSKQFAPVKMPGLQKFGNLTLKKGIFPGNSKILEWFGAVQMNTIKRATITINLLDEAGAPAMSWTLTNAFPSKITGTDLKADGNEVAVESIEIAHEGLTLVTKG